MPTINVPGAGSVNFPDSMTDAQITEAIQTNILPSIQKEKEEAEGISVGGSVAGVAQNLFNMASFIPRAAVGAVGGAVAGADKLARETMIGAPQDTPGFTETYEKTISATHWEPLTKEGKAIEDTIAIPFEKLAEWGQDAGNKTLETTGSPAAAAAVHALVEAGVFALPLARVKGKGKAARMKAEKSVAKSLKAETAKEKAKAHITKVREGLKVTPDKIEVTKARAGDIAKAEEFLATDLKTHELGTRNIRMSDGTVVAKPFAASINLEKTGTLKERQSAIDKAVQLADTKVTRESWDQTAKKARELGISKKEIKSFASDFGDSAARLEKMSEYVSTRTDFLVELSKKVKGGADRDVLSFAKELSEYQADLAMFSKSKADAARALTIQKKISKSLEGSIDAVSEALEGLGGRAKFEHISGFLDSLKNNKAAQHKFASKALDPRWSDALVELYINSLLSGIRTHVVNMTSNTGMQMLGTLEDYAAAGIGKVRKGDGMTFKEANARAYGRVQGIVDGAKAFADVLRTGETLDPLSKLELESHKAFSGKAFGLKGKAGKAVDVLGEYGVRLPGRFLMAEDELFKGIAKRSALRGLVTREIGKELKAGKLAKKNIAQREHELVTNPPKHILDETLAEARYYTFTTQLGKAGRGVQELTSQPLVRSQIPFVRTPINIVKRGLERSPLAIGRALKKEGIERDRAMARIAVGTGVGTLLWQMADKGFLTGTGPKDPDLRRNWRDTGAMPVAFHNKGGVIPGLEADKYYSLERLDPLAMHIGLIADMNNLKHVMTDKEEDEISELITHSISENLISKTYLENVSNLLEIPQGKPGALEHWFKSFVGSVTTPTLVTNINQVVDPQMRKALNTVDEIKKRWPGWSEDVIPMRNRWGEPIVRQGSLGPDIASPIFESQEIGDKLKNEVYRLELKLPYPPKEMNGIELTPREWDFLVATSGKWAKERLDKIVGSAGWDNKPRIAKEKIIRKMLSGGNQIAKSKLDSILKKRLREAELKTIMKGVREK